MNIAYVAQARATLCMEVGVVYCPNGFCYAPLPFVSLSFCCLPYDRVRKKEREWKKILYVALAALDENM